MKLTITATGRGKEDDAFHLICRALDARYDGVKTLLKGKDDRELVIDMDKAKKRGKW